MGTVQTTHAVIHLGIDAPDAQTLPVVVELDDPTHPVISLSIAKFSRYLQRQGIRSYESIRKTVVAIGKLRDFYLLVHEGCLLAPSDVKSLLEDFLFAFDHGSELGWRPASNQEYLVTRAAVVEYVKFLADDTSQLWGQAESQFIEACRASWTATAHAEKSLLFHTKKRGAKKSRGRKRVIVGLRNFKPFPPHLVQELIESTRNPRDKLLFALMAYGGRRLSEILHLFMADIVAREDELLVWLKHPSHTRMTWTNQANARVQGQRREYLKTVFDLLPRTEHGAKPSFAGWKGIKFDDEATLTSELYWIREAGKYLLELHRTYLHNARAHAPRHRHPYYFVAQSGLPLTIKAVEKQFRLACQRLEKKLGISLKGYGPHSLRHFYGFYCADVLKADLLMIQKWMGHIQISSTAIYAHISPGTAAQAMSRAEQVAKIEGRVRITEAERAEVSKVFANADLTPLPDVLALGTTAFGEVDTKKLRRRTLWLTNT